MLPHKFKSRIGFVIAGGFLALIYITYMAVYADVAPSDHLPVILCASLAGPLFGALLWPSRRRGAIVMILMGCLLMVMISLATSFGIGFFSEREMESRAAGHVGTWVGSFLGSLLMGTILTLFELVRSFGLLLLAGGVVGWLFRDKLAANDNPA